MSRWFRHYVGMVDDDKMASIAMETGQTVERVAYVWSKVLESAADTNDGGKFKVTAKAIAYRLRCETSDIGVIMEEMNNAGMIDDDLVLKWAERQYESDSARKRMAEYRERKRANPQPEEGADTVLRPCYVTPPSRDGSVTAQETDTDTDTEKNKTIPQDKPARTEFDEFYDAYPKHVDRKAAEKKYAVVVKSGGVPPQKLLAAAKAYADHCRANRLEPRFIKSPEVWLNKGCWDDDYGPPKSRYGPVSHAIGGQLSKPLARVM